MTTDSKQTFPISAGDTTEGGTATAEPRFDTIGYYAFDGVTDKRCAFWKASGIDTIELLDIGWYFHRGEPLEDFKERMKGWIDLAHQYGIKVVVVLLTNIEQWDGEGSCGNGSGKLFYPRETEKMNERLQLLEDNISYWTNADGFSLFAGDPGGVSGLTKEKGDIQLYLDMVKKVREIVREKVPNAFFNANIWAVSQWKRASANPFNIGFWMSEDENGKRIISNGELINSDIGIEIPGHDFYRPLALRTYSQADMYPEKDFPSAEYTDIAKANGTERIWGFAHFLLDELDDGDSEGNSRTILPSINTRYIKKYIDSMDEAGMNGVIAGTCSDNNALNLYAFSRFAQDSSLTPEQVLKEYASYLVPENQVKTLTEIFKFLENDTNWHQKMPDRYRLSDFATVFENGNDALEAARELTPLPESPYDLPESPATYIAKIVARVSLLADISGDVEETVPENTIRLANFNNNEANTVSVLYPSVENAAGHIVIAETGYQVVYKILDSEPVNLKEAREKDATMVLNIYADKVQNYAGYMQFSSAWGTGFVDETWTLDMQTSLQVGWNRIEMKLSQGYPVNSDISDWSKVGAWRIVLFGTEGDNLYLDNFDIVIN